MTIQQSLQQECEYIKVKVLRDIEPFMTILPNGEVRPIKLNEGAIIYLHYLMAQVLLLRGWCEAI